MQVSASTLSPRILLVTRIHSPRPSACAQEEGRGAFIPFTSCILGFIPMPPPPWPCSRGMPAAGADLIELGVPFTDPMADGPIVQAAGKRALKAGVKVRHILTMVREFRREDERDADHPDGLPEPGPILWHRALLRLCGGGRGGWADHGRPPHRGGRYAGAAGHRCTASISSAWLRPSTDDRRLPLVLERQFGLRLLREHHRHHRHAQHDGRASRGEAIPRIRLATDLPIAVGFGVRSPAQAAEAVRVADAAVVGSALCSTIEANLGKPEMVRTVLDQVRELAAGVRGARVNA